MMCFTLERYHFMADTKGPSPDIFGSEAGTRGGGGGGGSRDIFQIYSVAADIFMECTHTLFIPYDCHRNLSRYIISLLYYFTCIPSDLVNPCFFNPCTSQSEHSSWQPLLSVSIYNDSVIRMFHNPNPF